MLTISADAFDKSNVEDGRGNDHLNFLPPCFEAGNDRKLVFTFHGLSTDFPSGGSITIQLACLGDPAVNLSQTATFAGDGKQVTFGAD